MAHLSYKINKIIRDYVVFVVRGGNGVDDDTSGNNKTSFIQTEWKQFVAIKSWKYQTKHLSAMVNNEMFISKLKWCFKFFKNDQACRIGCAWSKGSGERLQGHHGPLVCVLCDNSSEVKLSLWNYRIVSACACFVPVFIILSRSSNKVPFRVMGHKKLQFGPFYPFLIICKCWGWGRDFPRSSHCYDNPPYLFSYCGKTCNLILSNRPSVVLVI